MEARKRQAIEEYDWAIAEIGDLDLDVAVFEAPIRKRLFYDPDSLLYTDSFRSGLRAYFVGLMVRRNATPSLAW